MYHCFWRKAPKFKVVTQVAKASKKDLIFMVTVLALENMLMAIHDAY